MEKIFSDVNGEICKQRFWLGFYVVVTSLYIGMAYWVNSADIADHVGRWVFYFIGCICVFLLNVYFLCYFYSSTSRIVGCLLVGQSTLEKIFNKAIYVLAAGLIALSQIHNCIYY